MSKTVIPVDVKGLIPTNAGVAVFLGNDEKVFTIYVDHTVGNAIGMFMNGAEKERPLTHDLIAMLMQALGAKVQRIVINDVKSGTYFGRLILTVENELQQKKIVELDARPSDCIALATQQKAPIFVSQQVWDEVEDMSDVLEQMSEQSQGLDTEDDD
ncbi:MAG: bifunctional nuclease family protein [Terrimicrobiaceae bacterium]